MRQIRPSTFSIVAHDPEAQTWGVAVESKFLAVGAVVPFAEAGVGAIATQSFVNTSYGPNGLALMRQGMSAQEVIEKLSAEDEGREHRQWGVVDANGHAATFTGRDCYGWAGGVTGPNYACQGNILANENVVPEMAKAFESTQGPLAERLIASLRAGQAAGGDKRGQQSAALFVVKAEAGYGGYTDHLVNLRVDDHPAPIEELARIYDLQQLYFGETKETVELDGDVLDAVQSMLHQLGYLQEVSGQLDDATKKALDAFCGTENLEMRLGEDHSKLDVEIYRFMQGLVKS